MLRAWGRPCGQLQGGRLPGERTGIDFPLPFLVVIPSCDSLLCFLRVLSTAFPCVFTVSPFVFNAFPCVFTAFPFCLHRLSFLFSLLFPVLFTAFDPCVFTAFTGGGQRADQRRRRGLHSGYGVTDLFS